MQIRTLNDQGIQALHTYVKDGAIGPVPFDLLQEGTLTSPVTPAIEIEYELFTSKLDACIYLDNLLNALPANAVNYNTGLWGWLSLFFFEQLRQTPLRETARYIPSADYRDYYRHRLAGPFRLFKLHGTGARVLLASELPLLGDLEEQFVVRQDYVTSAGLMKLLDRLYWDPATGGQKRGVTTKNGPGTIRRLLDLLDQLSLTYDLYGLSDAQIDSLLPKEFDRWR